MNDSEKIDIIFSKVGRIETDVAVIKQRDQTTQDRINSHEGKLAAIEQAVQSYHVEKAKLAVVAKFSSFIIGFLGTVLGGTLVFIITHYFIK